MKRFVYPSNMERIVSVSGGKDSTALYLMALEHQRPFRAVFADTGNEAPETYEYIHDLPTKTGGPPIRWVRAYTEQKVTNRLINLVRKQVWGLDKKPILPEQLQQCQDNLHPTNNQFLNSVLARGGFPSYNQRFCTDKLKVEPIVRQVYAPLIDDGALVVSWQGTRAQESPKRAKLTQREHMYSYGYDYIAFRPLLHWKLREVLDYLKRHNVPLNPLYHRGATRVGCWPCIFARDQELLLVEKHSPDKIEELARWEEQASKVTPSGIATFFSAAKLKKPGQVTPQTHGIKEQVKRARKVVPTYSLFDKAADYEREQSETCTLYGMCE